MARPRILNPDDAKALRKLGLTYTAIGELQPPHLTLGR